MEQVIHSLANAMCRTGCNVTVVAPRYRQQYHFDHRYRILRYGNPFRGSGRIGINFLSAIRALVKAHHENPFDVLHCHSASRAGLRAVLANKILHVPLVITPHGEDIQRIPEIGYGLRLKRSWDKIIRWNLSEADAVTAISDSIKLDLSFLPGEKIFDIPNGIHRETFVPLKCSYLYDLLGLESKNKIILTVGRYHMKKGYEYGIKAFELIANAGYRNLIYVIIGRGLHRLKPLVKSLNLVKKVHLISQLDRETLLKCYQSSWAFFSPSIVEGLSMVSIEAMSTGLPLIVTDVPGNLDIVRDNNCGVIVASKDPQSMAKGILRLLLTEGLYNRYSRMGVERAELYDWNNIAMRYIEAYRTAMNYRCAI